MIRDALLNHLYEYASKKGILCNKVSDGIYLKTSGWFILMIRDCGYSTAWKQTYNHDDIVHMEMKDPNIIKVFESIIDGYAK